MSLTYKEAYISTKAALQKASFDEASHEAKLIIAHITKNTGCLLFSDESLSAKQEIELESLIKRRLAFEPLQYIFGEWEFMGLPIKVLKGALIPRQDTEVLCEHALKVAKANGYRRVLDLCCGTGCLGIALNKLGGLDVTASDISPACVALARENAELVNAKLNVLLGSYFEPVSGKFELIVCNPPYLSAADMAALQPELEYEPKCALFGGEDGLDAYRRIALNWENYITPNGRLLLEIGKGQSEAIEALFGTPAERILDYSGVVRVLSFKASAKLSKKGN